VTCRSCVSDVDNPRERLAADDHWRVAHANGTALPGWLVLIPRRHVTAIADLTPEEAAGLGPWLVRLSGALRDVLGCTKTYVAQFAEAEGFSHVHFHVVPRMPDLAPDLRGPRVFALLGRSPADAISPTEAEATALRLSTHLLQDGG
jgi:diadenosine tetraphosphate (Ap4A) HIT family hydrolase